MQLLEQSIDTMEENLKPLKNFILPGGSMAAAHAHVCRSVARRVAHAIGFEGGLAAILVPVFAWWLQVSLWQALWMDLGLLLFFLVYTFVFNWTFDRVFGLPVSAQPAAVTAA